MLYCPKRSPRLNYTVDFIGSQLTKTPFYITQSKTEYFIFEGIKINYSDAPVTDNEIWIQPKPLLFELNICHQHIDCSPWHDSIVFFKTKGDLPFDIFAATFYLISRYEEYLPHSKDAYNRFSHTSSLAFKNGFLDKPLINLWIKQFGELLQKKFSEFKPSESIFQFIPTYDIDIAYAYQHKSFFRTAGGILKNATKHETLLERIRVLSGKQKDPFDIYDWLHQLHHKYQLQPVYFFLMATKNGLYDKNISPRNTEMQQLIFKHAEKYNIGVHPSWQTGKTIAKLGEEIASLTKITGLPVHKSRQHYIQLQMPDTYRNLIQQGILEDYSMGYGSINGFRASCCSSFYWYDLSADQSTNLKIHPFCFMEANSFFEQHFSAATAAKELQEYYNTVKMINGTLITIFHNHFLTQQDQWLPWRNMYADFIDKNFL